jgi:hypothetical protein
MSKTDVSNILDGDAEYTLREFQRRLSKLIKAHGPDARIKLDAGFNNVSVVVQKDD